MFDLARYQPRNYVHSANIFCEAVAHKTLYPKTNALFSDPVNFYTNFRC